MIGIEKSPTLFTRTDERYPRLYSIICTLLSVLCYLYSVICTLLSVLYYLYSVIIGLFFVPSDLKSDGLEARVCNPWLNTSG